MCTILLPIKPIYVNHILNGDKLYEYRKSIPKDNVNKIIIYKTSPIKKVVGEVEIEGIIKNTKEKVWDETNKYGCISKSKYDEYFKNNIYAYAYKLGKITKYKEDKILSDYGINFYPQSFVYINK